MTAEIPVKSTWNLEFRSVHSSEATSKGQNPEFKHSASLMKAYTNRLLSAFRKSMYSSSSMPLTLFSCTNYNAKQTDDQAWIFIRSVIGVQEA